MKCQLYCRCDDMTPYWVRWQELGELWSKNDFHPLDISELKPAFHKAWFMHFEQGLLHFQIGEISFDEAHGYVSFTNGRHRTILLSSLLNELPIAVDNSIIENGLFKNFLVRPIEKDELIELPDFEILSARQLRGQPAKSRGSV